jgi:mannose-6-phosphate isomerase-like protein (cupin superfamily)
MILSLKDTKATKDAEFLRDPYLEWTMGEGIPVIEDFGVDIFNTPTKPWARFGADGAIVHLKGRGDFVSVFVLELPPGGKLAPQSHLFEEVIYVLDGHGSTTIETGDGHKHSFEWGPKSLFALPLNARYQHFNGSGSRRARLASTNNMCVMMKLFRNADFLFVNGYAFPDRAVSADYLTGGGEFIPAPRGRLMWETNFVPDMGAVELLDNPKRGKGSATLQFILGEGMMHAHESLMPVGTYKKAHRHGPDYHVLVVDGTGFSLFWYEGDADFVRVDWRDGWMFAPPDQMYHQHFNTGSEPARYMATAIGNSRYPFTERNHQNKLGVDVSVKDGGGQIEFEDQDPRIHAMFLDALAANGATCRMSEFPTEAAG